MYVADGQAGQATGIMLFDTEGNARSGFTLEKNGDPFLFFGDKGNRGRFAIGTLPNADGVGIFMQGSDGGQRLFIGLVDDLSTLTLQDNDGKPRLIVGVNKTGELTFQAVDANGTPHDVSTNGAVKRIDPNDAKGWIDVVSEALKVFSQLR